MLNAIAFATAIAAITAFRFQIWLLVVRGARVGAQRTGRTAREPNMA